MGWSAVRTVWLKELVDTVRDKRTLYMMILLPLVLMPLITMAGPLLVYRQGSAVEERLPAVLVVADEDAAGFVDMLSAFGTLSVTRRSAMDRQAAEAAVRSAEVDLVVYARTLGEDGATVELELLYESTRSSSSYALRSFERELQQSSAHIVHERLKERGLDPRLLQPYQITARQDLTTDEEFGGRLLGMILPFFISMWAVMGGMYTAIDVAAGEKERGTLESLLMAPVSRAALVWGKLLAIVTVSFTANLLLIVSMVATVFLLMPRLLGADFALSFRIEPLTLGLILLLMLLFILMMAALLLTLSAFGKSFREGQSYTTALTFAVMLPGMYFAFVEEIEVARWAYSVPIFNVLLQLKNLFEGTIIWANIGITLVSLLVTALLSVFLAYRIFLNERVIFRT